MVTAAVDGIVYNLLSTLNAFEIIFYSLLLKETTTLLGASWELELQYT